LNAGKVTGKMHGNHPANSSSWQVSTLAHLSRAVTRKDPCRKLLDLKEKEGKKKEEDDDVKVWLST